MKVLKNPSRKETVEVIQDAIRDGELIILIGSLRGDYRGRASSKLGEGERMVILKPDGALLVHRPYGHSPVNWQPPGSRFEVKIFKNYILIESIRGGPIEKIMLLFSRVDLIVISKLKDEGEFSLYVDENDIRDSIFFEPTLLEDGFRVISREKRLPTGFVDLFGIDKNNRLTVVEIKKKIASKESVIQLKRYIDNLKLDGESDIRGILVASGLSKGCQELIEALGLEYKRVYPKKCYEILQRHRRGDRQEDLSRWLESA